MPASDSFPWILVLSLVAAAGLVAVFTWKWAGLRARAERATLDERLAARERELSGLRQRLAEREREVGTLQDAETTLTAKAAELEATLDAERASAAEKLELLEGARERLEQSFRSLSAEALERNNSAFLHLAKQNLEVFHERAKGDLTAREQAIGELVKPLTSSLEKVDEKIRELEQSRAEAYGTLSEQLGRLAAGQSSLERETNRLVQALRSPSVRGRWGEMQLRRVVEMAGMLQYCDFEEQPTGGDAESGRVRPDLTVRLPNSKRIVVDAKAPLESYLLAMEAQDEEPRRVHLLQHAAQVRAHLNKLAAKSYWQQFEPTPEFVVLFLPGETFFAAALEADPSLIEAGAEQRVILATPTTLIALLKAVAYGWRQEQVEKNALEIAQLGRALHERLRTMVGHFGNLRGGLDRAVESYNKAVGSFETRVLPQARKFKELEAASGEEIPLLEPIERAPRELQGQLDLLAGVIEEEE